MKKFLTLLVLLIILNTGFCFFDSVLLVNDTEYYDYFASVPVSYKIGAPIITTSQINSSINKLINFDVSEIIIIGGSKAVSLRMEDELKKSFKVERIGGATFYGTSSLIARRFFNKTNITLVNPLDYKDVFKATVYSKTRKQPLIYYKNDSGQLFETINILNSSKIYCFNNHYCSGFNQEFFNTSRLRGLFFNKSKEFRILRPQNFRELLNAFTHHTYDFVLMDDDSDLVYASSFLSRPKYEKIVLYGIVNYSKSDERISFPSNDFIFSSKELLGFEEKNRLFSYVNISFDYFMQDFFNKSFYVRDNNLEKIVSYQKKFSWAESLHKSGKYNMANDLLFSAYSEVINNACSNTCHSLILFYERKDLHHEIRDMNKSLKNIANDVRYFLGDETLIYDLIDRTRKVYDSALTSFNKKNYFQTSYFLYNSDLRFNGLKKLLNYEEVENIDELLDNTSLYKTKNKCISSNSSARNPFTGNCISFPTSCDIPLGWKEC